MIWTELPREFAQGVSIDELTRNWQVSKADALVVIVADLSRKAAISEQRNTLSIMRRAA